LRGVTTPLAVTEWRRLPPKVRQALPTAEGPSATMTRTVSEIESTFPAVLRRDRLICDTTPACMRIHRPEEAPGSRRAATGGQHRWGPVYASTTDASSPSWKSATASRARCEDQIRGAGTFSPPDQPEPSLRPEREKAPGQEASPTPARQPSASLLRSATLGPFTIVGWVVARLLEKVCGAC
jgi:hypothetical protein